MQEAVRLSFAARGGGGPAEMRKPGAGIADVRKAVLQVGASCLEVGCALRVDDDCTQQPARQGVVAVAHGDVLVKRSG